ncbi:MAG TPA: SMC family ATPase [Micromonosporaceae bacterium]|nr:SMC family ATPase [Micromonosporaceae bacterium]
MRPLRLDMVGFAAFREPTTVDFTDADFFALIGPTGSGKSTVLDAICFALYGTVPRWNDRRAIANALAPSTAEARVRLVFESAGVRYAATRVVRRDGKGRVSTTHAGLELLPRGFDLAKLDSGLDVGDLGDPLAGTPAEMDAAVLDAVGLPFEQFTSCVVLPQGQFAEFLHAKPAVRQQILVNLLGLSVYERVREQATTLAAESEAHLAVTDGQLAALADAEASAADAAARLNDLVRLAADIDRAVPALDKARQGADQTRTALTALDAELSRLMAVTAPADATDVAAAAAAARAAQVAAAARVLAAEEQEEKLRDELANAGDATELRRLLDAHAEQAQLTETAAQIEETVAAARSEHEKSAAALAAATAVAERADTALQAAEADVEHARTADRAATLRPHLVAGQPCPVCEQVVVKVPRQPSAPLLTAANAAHERARAASRSAASDVAARDRAVRELDRALAGVEAQRTQMSTRLANIAARLAGAPGPQALRDELATIAKLQRGVEDATAAVRSARDVARRTSAEARRAEESIHGAWRSFDAMRDGVAPFGPPATNRDDLADAWQALTTWAAREAADRRSRRADTEQAARRSTTAVEEAEQAIVALFAALDLDAAAGADHVRAATVAVEQARAVHARHVERHQQAIALTEARGGHERDARVARALALHLRANNFERWLLAEALDTLVDGASRILRELSAGQYDLGHDKGEFYVVDHHDAALRRPVRTLSGGETFQASLALALALAEQLADLSTGAASLDSIVLDEGFGTLDATTLDAVAATLENLAARGDRTVGVVTHVAALADRIPVRFEIRKDARTASVTRLG